MRKLQPLLVIFGCLCSANLSGQSEPAEKPVVHLSAKDTLFLTVANNKKYIRHTVKAKETLFSLARFYGLGLEELYENNTRFRTDPTLGLGEKVKIPVPNRAIKRYKTKNFIASKHAPICYVVQDGDNLFNICKRYFDMPVDSIAKRNRLKDRIIKPGQSLLMGWMGIEGIPPEWRPVRPVTQSDILKTRYDAEKKKHKEVVSQGVCFWQRDSKEKGDLYALHRDADIGTILMVENPMFRRKVYAKVIGRIPDYYERNIEVVVSPEAARKLGAKDPKFFVKLKYLK
jgi:LysM repeat protein